MEKHALAILESVELWVWPSELRLGSLTKQNDPKFKAIAPKLLSGFIAESSILGGTLVDQFWTAVAKCHAKLEENSS